MAFEQRKFHTSYVRELEIPVVPRKQPQSTTFSKSIFCRGEIPVRAVCNNPCSFLNYDFTYASTN